MKTTVALLFPILTLSASLALAHPDHDLNPGLPKIGLIGPISTTEKAYGRQGDPRQITRTIKLDMSDNMRLTPTDLNIKQGETIKFVLKNAAKSPIGIALGTATEQKERTAMLKQFPKMEMNQPNQVQAKPGEAGELIWQFTKAGEFNFGCAAAACVSAGVSAKILVVAP